MLKLEFSNPPRRSCWLVDKPLSVGRADENQLVIKDPSVAALHARIAYHAGSFVLRDLGSEHGTFINGQAVQQKTLVHGDVICFGAQEIKVVDPYAAEANAQPWLLVACSSWLDGQEFAVECRSNSEKVKVGRGKDCDIILPGTHLSREHAELAVQGDHLEILDLSSANGTFINDKRITVAAAYAGDRIRFDVYSFILVGPRPKAAPNAERPPIEAATAIDEPDENAPRAWKTPPTSPGNRIEPDIKIGPSRLTYFLAATLMAAALTVAVYIFWD